MSLHLLVVVLSQASPPAPLKLIDEKVLANWVDRTARLESNNNDWAIGDDGRSRGRYQIQAATWKRFAPSDTWWKDDAHNDKIARPVATDILRACVRACQKAGRPVTFANVRWYYRHGGF